MVEDDVLVSDDKAEKLNFELDGNIGDVSEDIIVTPKTTSQAVVASKAQSDKIITSNNIDNQKDIKGKVVDEFGEPIVGASVFINDKNATITDMDGKFILNKTDESN